MTFISFKFFFALLLTAVVYYLIPSKRRWIVLLCASILFYLQSGYKPTLIVFLISIFSFVIGIMIEKCTEKKKANILIFATIILLLGTLEIFKTLNKIPHFSNLVITITGISYFTLSIIGYLLDIYWGKEKAEKNFGLYLCFVYYFPKIIQGPIASYKNFAPQIKEGTKYDYEEICYGLQLIIWGLFKKIVIADRLLLVVNHVYGNIETYSQYGLILAFTMIVSAFQLYLDFSGYTDIAIGVSQVFGIKIESNFNRPFLARSAAEFWQRWHMSLGTWFKEYLFLPVSRSALVKKISKNMGTKYGPVVRKKTMTIISLIAVWLATALWHGTGINYLVWGAYWGGIIIVAEIFKEKFEGLKRKLKINTSSFWWRLFQMLRTFAIFTVGKMISAQSSLYNIKVIVASIIKRSHINDLELILKLGMSKNDYIIVVAGGLTVLLISILQEKDIKIRETIGTYKPLIRWTIYVLSISVILLFGLYGAGYDVSTFAYAAF